LGRREVLRVEGPGWGDNVSSGRGRSKQRSPGCWAMAEQQVEDGREVAGRGGAALGLTATRGEGRDRGWVRGWSGREAARIGGNRRDKGERGERRSGGWSGGAGGAGGAAGAAGGDEGTRRGKGGPWIPSCFRLGVCRVFGGAREGTFCSSLAPKGASRAGSDGEGRLRPATVTTVTFALPPPPKMEVAPRQRVPRELLLLPLHPHHARPQSVGQLRAADRPDGSGDSSGDGRRRQTGQRGGGGGDGRWGEGRGGAGWRATKATASREPRAVSGGREGRDGRQAAAGSAQHAPPQSSQGIDRIDCPRVGPVRRRPAGQPLRGSLRSAALRPWPWARPADQIRAIRVWPPSHAARVGRRTVRAQPQSPRSRSRSRPARRRRRRGRRGRRRTPPRLALAPALAFRAPRRGPGHTSGSIGPAAAGARPLRAEQGGRRSSRDSRRATRTLPTLAFPAAPRLASAQTAQLRGLGHARVVWALSPAGPAHASPGLRAVRADMRPATADENGNLSPCGCSWCRAAVASAAGVQPSAAATADMRRRDAAPPSPSPPPSRFRRYVHPTIPPSARHYSPSPAIHTFPINPKPEGEKSC